MSYSYPTLRPFVFSEPGQDMLLKIRDFAEKTLKTSGAVRMDALMNAAGGGESWNMMACVDRLVERKELIEVTPHNCTGQHRIFTRYEH